MQTGFSASSKKFQAVQQITTTSLQLNQAGDQVSLIKFSVCFQSRPFSAFNFHNLLYILSSFPPHFFSESCCFLSSLRNSQYKGYVVMPNELVFLIEIKDIDADSPTSVNMKGYICPLRPVPTLHYRCPSTCRSINGLRIFVKFSDMS